MVKYSRSPKQLTLVELVVVLLVLIALAGVIIPRFSGMLTQAHVAATTTNVPAIESSVRARVLLKSGDIGNRFDSLIVDPSGTPAIATYMPGATFWEPLNLTADDLSALAKIGVTQVVTANAQASLTDGDATFGSHDTAPITPIEVAAMRTAGGEDVSMLTSFNMTPKAGARYIAFGIGTQCTLCGGSEGAAFSEPPVHFGDTVQTRSNVAYTRYFLIVELSDAGTANAEARLLGAAAPHENGLERNQAHLKEFYSQ